MSTPQDRRQERDKIMKGAAKAGVTIHGIPRNAQGEIDAGLLQERINNHYAAQRAKWIWRIALASAVASIVSAVAAWTAVSLNAN